MMTYEQFCDIRNRIKAHAESKTRWYDGEKYTDPQGNWYASCDGGYNQYLFYAGEKWTCSTRWVDGKYVEIIEKKEVQ